MPASNDPGVELRVENALRLIEQAQNDLARAAAELSGIAGGMSMWQRTSRLSGACRTFWYALKGSRRSRWVLDGMHSGDLQAALKQHL